MDFFSFAEAWNQTGLMFGALLLVGLGGGLIADWFYKRKKGRRCEATIVGVREEGNVYYPVVEYYSREKADTIRAETNVGSSSLKGKEPGTRVNILVMPGKEDKATIDNKVILTVGVILMIPGFVLGYIALAKYDFSIWSIILPILLIAVLGMTAMKKLGRGFNFRKRPVSKYALHNQETAKAAEQATDGAKDSAASAQNSSTGGIEGVASALFAGVQEKRSKGKIKGDLMDEAAFADKKMERARQMRKVGPFVMLIGLGLLAGGIWTTQDLLHMLNVGQRVQGVVIQLEESYSSSSSGGSSYTYYPIVEFYLPDTGERIEFKDNMGSNPPSYDRGEEVTVLYDPADPHDDVFIDKGIWNWMLPGILTVMGALAFLLSLKSWLSARRTLERA